MNLPALLILLINREDKMWKIIFNDFDPHLLIWKYRGKIRRGLYRNKISVPHGFYAVVNKHDQQLKRVFEGDSDNFRNVSDIYFIRKNIENQPWGAIDIACIHPENKSKTVMNLHGTAKFYVRDAKELVKNISSLGPEISITYFWIEELLPQLRPIIRKILLQDIIEKKFDVISRKLEINLFDISRVFNKYGLCIESFIITDII